jgi:hypothetical protein
MIEFHTDGSGLIKRAKVKKFDVQFEFRKMLGLVKNQRVKFVYYSNNRPVKCSGYMISLVVHNDAGARNYCIFFRDVKFGSNYSKLLNVQFKNIRFVRTSMICYYEYILKNQILSNFFYNHFEREKLHESLTKFSFL